MEYLCFKFQNFIFQKFRGFNYTRVHNAPRSCNVIAHSLVNLALKRHKISVFIHFVELIKVIYFSLKKKIENFIIFFTKLESFVLPSHVLGNFLLRRIK